MRRILGRSLFGSCLLLLPLAAARADDDDRGPRGIPPGHLPRPGECRVWHDGRPPGHQPPPTDCATAHAQAARYGGRVVYGSDRDDWRERGRGWDRDDDWDDDDRDDWDDDRDGGDRRYGRERGRYEDRWDRREMRCADRDRDGWCDGSRYPVRLPEMAWGVAYSRGQWVPALGPWLQDARLGVRFPRAGRRGLPREIVWFDRGDRVVQRWLDLDGDGRAERVELYRGGAPWRVLRYR